MARQTKKEKVYEEYKTQAEPRSQAGKVPVFCAYDKLMNPKDLIGNPRNPNKHPQSQIELLAHIIQSQGWRAPITVSNRSGFVVRGHGRLAAALSFGAECVPVDYQNYATEAEEWADLIADNRLSELSEIDDHLIADLMSELDDLPIYLSGYEEGDLQKILDTIDKENDIQEDDFETEVPEEPKTKRGQVFKLGRHRLMCGDSTSEEDVKKLVGDNQIDLLMTDPPYNVDYQGKRKVRDKIKNDSMNEHQFYEFLKSVFENAKNVMKAGAAFYICHADSEGYNFRTACHDIGWKVRECLIWKKNRMIMGRMDYHYMHEPILYGWNEGSHAWYSDRKQTTVIEYKAPLRSDLHPTMKPIGLFNYLIKNSTKSGDLVLDLFGGSGTTIMACEQNGRNAYSMELDEGYCDVIIDRWEKFTGGKAELVED